MLTIDDLILILFALGIIYAGFEDFKRSRQNRKTENFDFISFKIK